MSEALPKTTQPESLPETLRKLSDDQLFRLCRALRGSPNGRHDTPPPATDHAAARDSC
jgi:hypothetical protein